MNRPRAALSVLFLASTALATPEFVEHLVANQVYGEASGVTMREPEVPREDEPVELWARIGYSFFYTDVAIYYTLDGSDPTGAFGVGGPGTTVLRSSTGAVNFVRNEPSGGGNIDWWRAYLSPSLRTYGTTLRYKIGAWHSGGGPEVFANNYGCSDGTCNNPGIPPTYYQFTVRLAWPGAGAGQANPGAGYPPVSFWKEEAVAGNNYMNVQIDQNATVYDIYYPSAGCVQGMGTRNEGYSDGLDTFPPGLPPASRGQMNVNQLMPGIRVGGLTHWLSNPNAVSYFNVSQYYVGDTNVVQTNGYLNTGVGSPGVLGVSQFDFCPKGVTYPNDDGGQPNRGIYVKRMVLTNASTSPLSINVYFYGDFALNGGDGYDGMFTDAPRGAMAAYDNTYRLTSSSGEYNPTSFSDYEKDVSVYLAAAMKACAGPNGEAPCSPATDFWSDTSSDQGQGWIGMKLDFAPNQSREVSIAVVGGFDPFAGATATYAYQIENALDWFHSNAMIDVMDDTLDYWGNWLAAGVTIDTPDDDYDRLFKRGLLATALHLDGKHGGVVAGMHNGAYPFVWPRDAVYAAMTLDRTGHTAEAAEVYRFLRDVAYRDFEPPSAPPPLANRKGFWKQKYTTDGYAVWNAPQVDETAVVPWGVYYHHLCTAAAGFLSANYAMVRDAVVASTEDSVIDSRLYYDNPNQLTHSNNVWEDAFDDFIYSNANVERGLRDAASIASILGIPADAADAIARANNIHAGLIGRLTWDGENTDISQLGLTYPFDVFGAKDPLVVHVVDRMNGVATDNSGNNRPLVNFSGEFQDLIDRYWCDRYWNGALTYPNCPAPGQPSATPWFLSTLWYGLYYAERQDLNPGKADIDNHKYRIDLCLDRRGPAELMAEQIAPSASLQYPAQTDFTLQTAWPNAWESASTLVDAMMKFLDARPDAPGNAISIEPKLPTAWSTMTFKNVTIGNHRADLACDEGVGFSRVTATNLSGTAFSLNATLRIPAGQSVASAKVNGANAALTHDAVTGRVQVSAALAATVGAVTEIIVRYPCGEPCDTNCDGSVNPFDIQPFVELLSASPPPRCSECSGDANGDGTVNPFDINAFLVCLGG